MTYLPLNSVKTILKTLLKIYFYEGDLGQDTVVNSLILLGLWWSLVLLGMAPIIFKILFFWKY